MKSIATIASASALLCAVLVSGQMTPVRAAPSAAGAAAGETLFKQRCAMCHAVAGKGGKLGPDLAGVYGRKAGATTFRYSPAMKASKTVWNAATLDRYLAAPTKAIPGTRMVISVAKPTERKAIISYLAAANR
jgi:cytochrome c